MKRLILLIMVCFLVSAEFACSKNDPNPAIPADNQFILDELPVDSVSTGNHQLWGVYEMVFDLKTMKCEVRPSRINNVHINITSLIPPPGIVINGYDPGTGILNVDVTINNPHNITGYDVRLIIYKTSSSGPLLINDDGWTTLYDITGGWPINPYKAYGTDISGREFEPYTEKTENLLIEFPGGLTGVQFAVDASFPTNCTEPYYLDNFHHDVLLDYAGAENDAFIDSRDWQANVSSVHIGAQFITGDPVTDFSQWTGETWKATLVNTNAVAVGQYQVPVWALSSDSGGLAIYNVVEIEITGAVNWPVAFGANLNDIGYGVGIDPDDEFYYSTGTFIGLVDFDPGPGEDFKHNYGSQFSYLSKFSSSGVYQWARTWGKWPDNSAGYDVIVDSTHNIYVTGYFGGTVDFNPDSGIDTHISNGAADAYLCKYDPLGNFLWARTWGGTGYDKGKKLAIDENNNIYLTGYFHYEVDFDPGPGQDLHMESNISQDVFLSKFNFDGDWQWTKTWGGEEHEESQNIALDGLTNIYLAGSFEDTMDFNPDPLVTDGKTSNGAYDAYLIKLNQYGNYEWSQTWGGMFTETADSVFVYANVKIYVAGTFTSTTDFDPGPDDYILTPNGYADAYFSIMGPGGEHAQTVAWGGDSDTYPAEIRVDSSDNVIIAGTFDGEGDFDPTPGVEDIITSNGSFECFVSSFDNLGLYNWTSSWGSYLGDWLYALEVDKAGNSITSGYFSGTVDFAPGPDEVTRESDTLSPDVFLTKLDGSGNLASE